MVISELYLKNYRNLKENHFRFDKQINYIYGKNAQGKTNLLESIWMFTGARSFRKTKDLDLVNFEKSFAKVEGDFFLENRNQKISINFAEGKRRISLNGVAKRYPTEMIGKFRAIIFTPQHLSLIKDGAENRRKFLDAALCQLNSSYVSEISEYSKILKQRNALLKQIYKQSSKPDCLDIWNEKLVFVGTKILEKRLKYLCELSKEAMSIYAELSGGHENLKLKYVSSIMKNQNANEFSKENVKKNFLEKLKNSENFDIKQGFTSVGPHRDDLEIILQNLSLKKFGSQGQQRSVVLTFKLAEAKILKQKIGEFPVVLLDDIMSELDDFRVNYIMNKLSSYQTFITGCNKNSLQSFKSTNIFRIENGGLF